MWSLWKGIVARFISFTKYEELIGTVTEIGKIISLGEIRDSE